ncbi:MAG: hypothetical protein IPG43_04845 [Proteobacteria bacterium]|nr:hypothetical protein [Pseudomonadota bacterium]
MDDVLRPSLLERHLERVEHEFGTQVVGHGPTDDAPAADVSTTARYRKPAQVGT